jgi:Ca2+-binding EF-hand superfamily protein
LLQAIALNDSSPVDNLSKESIMSSISIASGLSNDWANAQTQRIQRQAKLFAKVDTNSSGGVDQSELQGLLTDISQKTGKTLDAAKVFKSIDINSDGSLSGAELAKGMKAVMRPSHSTLDFAQKRSSESGSKELFNKVDSNSNGSIDEAEMTAFTDKVKAHSGRDSPTTFAKLDVNGDGQLTQTEFDAGKPKGSSKGAGRVDEAEGAGDADDARGVKGAGAPPPPGGPGGPGAAQGGAKAAGGAAGTESTSSASTSYDPLDTNQDGKVSELERLAGALKDLVSTIESSNSGSSSKANDSILKLAKQVYAQIASFATPGATNTLDAVA